MTTSRHDYVAEPESVGRILARLAEADPLLETQSSRPTVKAGRDWTRMALAVLGAVLVVQLVVAAVMLVQIPTWMGHDFSTYRDAAARWLSGGSYFHPYQLAGPYEIDSVEVLYPPVALVLFAPFVHLPAPLWVLIPVAVIGWIVWAAKPSPLGWLAILLLFTFPQTRPMSWAIDLIGNGNPVLWITMFVALATRYPLFGPFAWLKPTPLLVGFGLIGIRQRAWWIGLAILVGVSALFLPLWLDYVTVLLNARGGGLLYAPTSLPMVLIPVVATLLGDAVGADRAGRDVAR